MGTYGRVRPLSLGGPRDTKFSRQRAQDRKGSGHKKFADQKRGGRFQNVLEQCTLFRMHVSRYTLSIP